MKGVSSEGGSSLTEKVSLVIEEEAIPRIDTPDMPGHRSSPIALAEVIPLGLLLSRPSEI